MNTLNETLIRELSNSELETVNGGGSGGGIVLDPREKEATLSAQLFLSSDSITGINRTHGSN